MDTGLSYLSYLPELNRHPPLAWGPGGDAASSAAPGVMEPGDIWTLSARLGWQPQSSPPTSPGVMARPNYLGTGISRPLFTPMTITIRPAVTSDLDYRLPSDWLSFAQHISPTTSPAGEQSPSPPRVETPWEVFEYLSGIDARSGISLPELNQSKRLARRLLRHAQAPHRQGLKVFYIATAETTLGACPAVAADPDKLLMHAALANALLHHPKAAQEPAIKKAIFAAKPAGRPGLLRSSPAARVAAWAPKLVGGTRLIMHTAHRRAPKGAAYFTLEPSDHYAHTCHAGPLFEQLAQFHANVLHLGGYDAPLWAAHASTEPLVRRIEALRQAPISL